MDAYSQYQTQAVSTASPAQLVQMLYQGAVGAVVRAEQALGSETPGATEAAHRDLVKAQDIVTELAVSLDHEQGGEIAVNLASLYQYCLEQLQHANVHKDPAPLASVRGILAELSQAWEEVVRQSLATPAMAVG